MTYASSVPWNTEIARGLGMLLGGRMEVDQVDPPLADNTTNGGAGFHRR